MEKSNYFTRQSREYASFRPTYPDELYRFLLQHVIGRSAAWDCGTGNGQVARVLALHFEKVHATDLSQTQLDYAFPAENIIYTRIPAEHTNFGNDQFDLVTVAQAAHWFDIQDFYSEVRRTARPGAVLAIWGYSLPVFASPIHEQFLNFYHRDTGPYWDPARRLIENHYRDLPFPFEEVECPDFVITAQWNAHHFAGYLKSWSAVQKYIVRHGVDPVPAFMHALKPVWEFDELKTVRFPVFMRLGRVGKP